MDCFGENLPAVANHFNFNTENGRFVFSRGFGFIGDMEGIPPDSIYISYGTCDKF